jgi:hypothetical protein
VSSRCTPFGLVLAWLANAPHDIHAAAAAAVAVPSVFSPSQRLVWVLMNRVATHRVDSCYFHNATPYVLTVYWIKYREDVSTDTSAANWHIQTGAHRLQPDWIHAIQKSFNGEAMIAVLSDGSAGTACTL